MTEKPEYGMKRKENFYDEYIGRFIIIYPSSGNSNFVGKWVLLLTNSGSYSGKMIDII